VCLQNSTKTLSRHGLIAGATGIRKTKTIQVLLYQLSAFRITVLILHTKRDFSGISKEGEKKPLITERYANINISYITAEFPL
jgi:DNA helicase HerA-like ATPase